MNNVSLIGRLTAEPEIKKTQSGLAVTRFCIAVDRQFVKQGEEKQTDFINIIAWRQTAEFICKYFTKGQRIALTGRIVTGSYTDKDGNKRYTFEVQADNVEFCEAKRDSGSTPANTNNSSDNSGGFVDMPNDEDLPF